MALGPLSARDRQINFLGGVRSFDTREALAADVADLPEGATVLVSGQPYIIDGTATGANSALHDLGVDGVRRADRLENLFVAAHFTTQDDTTIHISASLDGIHFALINAAVLPGSGGYNLSQRDPSITFFDGWWWIFGTGGSAGSHDFVLFRSRDLSVWSKHQVIMGGGPYFSATNPMPGGVSPASAIWAPEPFIEDGVMHVMVSIRYGADFTNIYGSNQQHFKPFVCTLLDTDALTFSAPVAMTFGAGYPENVRQWDQTAGANIAPTTQLKHQGTLTADWGGFEMSLMERLARDYPNDTILLVPAGKGGAGFSNGEWTSGGAARVGFAARLNAAIAANPGATIEGMFWQQGEADRSNASYQTQLTDFLTYCRTTWPALASRPIVLGEMGTFVSAGITDINSVIAAVASSQANYTVASSEGLTDKGDSLRFDTNSYRALGDNHYSAWKAKRGTLPGGSGATRIFIIAGEANAVGWGPAYHSYASGTSMIDPSVVKHNGRYYCAIKDSVFRRIRTYSAASLVGPWAFSQSLGDTAREIEAPCLTRFVNLSAINGETRRTGWRVYVDHNRTGPTDPSPNSLVGAPYYFEADFTPVNDFGAMQPCFFETPVRHGSVVNLADLDPVAAQSFTMAASAARASRPSQMTQQSLSGGTAWIRPQPDVTYFVDATTGSTDLTIRNGPADRFYLAAFSAASDVGINVLTGAFVNRGFLVGFGMSGDCLIEMRRKGSDGAYYPVGAFARSRFRALKSVDQTGLAAGVEHLISWPVVGENLGGAWDTAQQRYIPPRGVCDITARAVVAGLDSGENNYIMIKKNGVALASSFFSGDGGAQASGLVSVGNVPCNGTDYFEVFVQGNGTTPKIVRGSANATEFSGISR